MRIDRVKFVTLLAKHNMKSCELAKQSGVSRVTISSIKCGKSCTPETAIKIARALNVDVTEILEEV